MKIIEKFEIKKIKSDDKRKIIKIFSNQKTHDKLIEILVQNNLFVKDKRKLIDYAKSGNFCLEVDYRGLKKIVEDTSIAKPQDFSFKKESLDEEVKNEEDLQKGLKQKNYTSEIRIWQKNDSGQINYFCEVEDDIYSCGDLDNLISLINGEILVESDKPIIDLSPNPLKAFGVFKVAQRALGTDKSIIRYDLKKGPKKQFQPIVEKIRHQKIIIDGADDTANALNNTGLPQQTISLLQGLLIFPAFLKGVHLGYEGLGEEAKETYEEYQERFVKIQQLKVKLEEFKNILQLSK